MKYLSYGICFLIGVATAALFWKLSDIRSEKSDSYEIVRIDTIRKSDSVYVPIPYPIEIIPAIIPSEIDTQAVIADYYSKKVYRNDTVINTDKLIVSITDTVTENSLSGRSVYYTFEYPEVTRYKIPKDRLSINADTRGIVNLAWQRNRFVFSAGYDIANKKPVVGFGINIFEK
ncbi:hypothetical protein [Dysgonomonas macrotermitis]|uniref:Uncharacterized protein n=1 Tax=Dysgonomonas macrotermitis TaxID=1346286 RepID=A0A1M4UJD5_9BACT|nr:hypothetical protein [Dysgonomonas macrotermitis]SHE56809.1 hypothetical protein SAMN05444362_101621 [Dysgonomonas macrotermitis]